MVPAATVALMVVEGRDRRCNLPRRCLSLPPLPTVGVVEAGFLATVVVAPADMQALGGTQMVFLREAPERRERSRSDREWVADWMTGLPLVEGAVRVWEE